MLNVLSAYQKMHGVPDEYVSSNEVDIIHGDASNRAVGVQVSVYLQAVLREDV